MVREATGKAQRILEAADEREREEKEKLRALEAEVSAFKGSILTLYQKHIEALSELDDSVEKVHTTVFGPEDQPQPEEPDMVEPEQQAVDEPSVAEVQMEI